MGRESIIQDSIKAAREFSCSTAHKEYLVKTVVLCCVGPGLRAVRNTSDFTRLFSTQRCPVDMAPGKTPRDAGSTFDLARQQET